MEHVRVLSSEIGPRPAGSQGETRAASYIEGVFGALGYEVERQEVRRLDGGISYNILARRPGTDRAVGYAVVGGHYDTVAGSPGANDNASGTGIVLALAEAFAMHEVQVEFVAFAAEELQPTNDHHVGSRAYVAQLGDARRVVAMVSIDMVGNGPSLLIVRQTGHTDALQKELASVAAQLGVPYNMISRGDISDHSPFAHSGVLAAFLWSGSHPTHHRPSDVLEVVQRDSVDRAGRVAFEWIFRGAGVS
jgi:Zn-dependent M28 family amino/carboxypeptidase